MGCHYMSTYMDRNILTHTHMGGEGANWIGQAPFVDTGHVFQNIGDGTYYHSGLLAIRACVAAGVNITFKVLFNDAVAMTGGQPLDGPLTPIAISQQVYAEGVRKVVVVSDEPEKYPVGAAFAPGVVIEHRSALDRVQRDCREWPGVSVLIYDQICAAEKRRRRKRGRMIDPPRRMLINDLVCEGCGDCNVKSNCLSVVPFDTAFGRKRQIDQSSCNKDYSCAEGFCPSFVSVLGGGLRRAAAEGAPPAHLAVLPEPAQPALEDGRPYSILITGVGGTGVVTIGALLTMAAHMEGKVFSAVDQFGMAQKGGSVTSHVRLAASQEDIRVVRLHAGSADLVLGCDSLVTGGELALSVMAPGQTRVLVNTHEQITGHFTRNPDLAFPTTDLAARITAAAGAKQVAFIDATRLATRLLGDSIASNLFMLGYAYQQGLIPVSAEAIEATIELNGVTVEMNKQAFAWGRRAALDWSAVSALVEPTTESGGIPTTLDEILAHRTAELAAYQDATYAERYRALVERVRAAEASRAPGMSGLAEAVARYTYKLMAYKDEYEVARLYTDGRFQKALGAGLRGRYSAAVPHGAAHLRPPRQGDGPQDEVHFRALDAARLARPGQVQRPPRHSPGSLRLQPRAPHRAPLDRGLRGSGDGTDRRARPRQPRARPGNRLDPGEDPRLRPRQGASPRRSDGRAGSPARRLAPPRCGRPERGGISASEIEIGVRPHLRRPLVLIIALLIAPGQ